MGFLDKAKAAAEQAATRAKEGVEEVQTKRNLSHAYEELGRTAFDLIEEGQISHDRLTALADEVRKLKASAEAQPEQPVGTTSTPSGDGEAPTG
jgi:hypothetical protein